MKINWPLALIGVAWVAVISNAVTSEVFLGFQPGRFLTVSMLVASIFTLTCGFYPKVMIGFMAAIWVFLTLVFLILMGIDAADRLNYALLFIGSCITLVVVLGTTPKKEE